MSCRYSQQHATTRKSALVDPTTITHPFPPLCLGYRRHATSLEARPPRSLTRGAVAEPLRRPVCGRCYVGRPVGPPAPCVAGFAELNACVITRAACRLARVEVDWPVSPQPPNAWTRGPGTHPRQPPVPMEGRSWARADNS
jgi:hypothetical protein